MKEEEIVRLYREAVNQAPERYEENVVPLFRPLAERLIELCQIREGERVLDIGTGTGLAALLAAPLVGESGYVLGIDVAEGMLAIAHRKAAGWPNVEFRQMDARSLSLPPASFDLVLSSFGLPYTHPEPTIKEAHRVLRDRGRLVFQDWGTPQEGDDEAEEIFQQVLDKYRVKRPRGWTAQFRKARQASMEIWESVDEPEAIEDLVEGAGFSRTEALVEHHPTFLLTPESYFNFRLSFWGNLAEMEAMSAEKRKAFREEAIRALSRVATRKGILLPWVVIRVRGFKG